MAPLINPPHKPLIGISVITQVKTHTLSYLGSRIPPGQIFIGATIVKINVPVKITTNVIVKYISKKLSAGDDIQNTLQNKFKQVELRIVYKSSIINIK